MLSKIKTKFAMLKAKLLEKMEASAPFACLMYFLAGLLVTGVVTMAGGALSSLLFGDVTDPSPVAVGFSVAFVLATLPALGTFVYLCKKRLSK